MRILGGLVLGSHSTFLLASAVLIGASFAGFTGGTLMVVGAILALLLWGCYAGFTVCAVMHAAALVGGNASRLDACVRWAHVLFLLLAILAPVTALGLGFMAFARLWPVVAV